ncbi:MAG: hypothetical protein DWQ19_09150 [Crenarchaeota archaeon]|nr:MAG: hypothetical protein DWQ19_09150 [Thermoproteota archaeon]
MPPIPNPHNNFLPIEDDVVRVIGACHPSMLHTIALVEWANSNDAIIFFVQDGKEMIISGPLGGLEFITNRSLFAIEKDIYPTRNTWRKMVKEVLLKLSFKSNAL